MTKVNLHAGRHAGLAVLLLSTVFSGGPVLAQTDAAAKAAAASKIAAAEPEEVVVTGSRVRRLNATSPQPLTVVNSETFKATGFTNIAQTLNQLTQVQPSTNTQNTNLTLFAAGQATIDIRGLGTNRTLVLVNGKRHQAGSFTSSAVDLNGFAANYIERSEVITGGASAAYGSEAISGVVNLITRKNLEGIEVDSQAGISDKGDGSTWNISVSAGHRYFNDRAYSIVAAEMTRDEPILAENRDFANPGIQYNTVANPNVLAPRQVITSVSQTGVFRGLNAAIALDRSKVNTIPVQCRAGQFGCYDTADFVYGYIYTPLTQKLRRTLVNSYNEYVVSDHLKATAEFEYSAVVAKDARGQPGFNTAQRIFRDNAYVLGADPVATQLRAAFDAAGLRNPGQSTTAGFFFDDLGQRIATQKRYSNRVAVGLEGDVSLLSRKIKWDGYYTYGQTVGTTYGEGGYFTANLANSFDAVIDPTTGSAVCRSAVARAAGCVPYDFIRGPSAAAKKYVNYVNTVYGRLNQNVAAINFNTDLFELPAGPVGVAVGAEYRNEELSQTFDPETIAGTLFTNQRANVVGSLNVKEAYAEAVVPILKDLPFVKYLGAEIAGRTAQYSTAGYAKSFKLGGEYQPTEDLRIRSTTARSLRAPNLFELFSPLSDNFTSVNDPCDRRVVPTAPNPTLRAANCIAQIRPNLPGYDPTTFISGTGPGGQSTHLLQGGNPNLSPEQGITFTAGAVVTPRWIPGLSISADYFTVTVRDVVATLGTATTYQFCYDAAGSVSSNPYCSLISRDYTGTGPYAGGFAGTVSAVKLINLNLARYRTSGVDYEASYRFDVAPVLSWVGAKTADAGELALRVNATNVQTYSQQGNPTLAPLSFENVLGTPRWNVNGTLTWSNDKFSVSWNTRYISDQEVNNTQNPATIIPFYYKAYMTHGVSMRYLPTSYLTVRAGITNLTDSDPPISLLGNGTGSSQYETRGRYLFGGVTVKY
jgi:outer membrane receptor protein involved in Fe transport